MPAKNALFAAFVPARVCSATVKSVDASAALAMPGVVDFIDAADLGPAANVTQDIMVHQEGAADPGRQVFAGEKVQFWGQPVGVLLADSRAQAEAAIFAVKVEYADVAAKLVVDTEIPLSWEKGETPRTMRTGRRPEPVKIRPMESARPYQICRDALL